MGPVSRTISIGGSQFSGVNRSTVYRAYEELWAQGYIEGRQGSYSRVRKRTTKTSLQKVVSTIPWRERSSAALESVHELMLLYRPEGKNGDSDSIIDFSRLDMDPRLMPVDSFRRCLDRVLRRDQSSLLNYCSNMGYEPLREFIATRLRIHGIDTTAERIILTNGSQHALDLILRLLVSPGSSVAVETPTYANMLPLLRLHDAEIAGIPMRADGADLEELAQTIKDESPSLFYTMPNFQNPTGISTTQTHREVLLDLCGRNHIPIVEDGFEEEMKYFGRVALPIKSMDRDQIVIYVGTFSKVLMPGVRIGWIAADAECIDRLVAIMRFTEISSSPLLQAATLEFCRRELYEVHIRRMHRTYRKRMQRLLKAVREHLNPDLVTWTEPAGGYLMWASLKNQNVEMESFNKALTNHGIRVSPGEYYFVRNPESICFRLSIAKVDETQIDTGVRRLARALEMAYA